MHTGLNYFLRFVSERIWFQMQLSTDFLWPLVKALIFLLRLVNKIFFAFLNFHKWSHTHTFLLHCRLFVHAVLLPPNYGCCCFSKLLELGFIMATRGATMMIVEIDSPAFPLITFIIREKSRKMKVSQSPLEESSWSWRTRVKQIFCSSRKDSHTGNALLHCL